MKPFPKNSCVVGWIGLIFLAGTLFLAGCQSSTPLMPTPNLYAGGNFDPFENVPPELQNNHVDVLYFTDRAPEGTTHAGNQYGYKRSRSVGFGLSEVDIGKNVSWDQLVKASRSSVRLINLNLRVAKTTELMRFPQTPRSIVQVHQPATEPAAGFALLGDDEDAEEVAAEDAVRKEISAQLAKTPVKEVYIFVHGFDNTFDDSVETIAEMWHFLGREGVPIAYSWPAGSKGLLRGYEYDTASSEFTVYHLKQMLRVIASCPDVQKINIIAHSRGTDTTITALKELHLELHASGRNTRAALKLGTLVLAAPDIDVDVVIQNFANVRLGQVPERFCLYINSKDKALSFSSWLAGGIERLGGLKATTFTPAELKVLRDSKTTQIVDARVTNPGDFGHDYYHANPAVSSDLILLMRYHLSPGVASERPLRAMDNGFWAVDDGYPGPATDMTAKTNGK